MIKGIINLEVMSEDWKTALARNQRNLKKGEEVTILEEYTNLYGRFYRVRASDGETFEVNPSNVDIKGGN